MTEHREMACVFDGLVERERERERETGHLCLHMVPVYGCEYDSRVAGVGGSTLWSVWEDFGRSGPFGLSCL